MNQTNSLSGHTKTEQSVSPQCANCGAKIWMWDSNVLGHEILGKWLCPLCSEQWTVRANGILKSAFAEWLLHPKTPKNHCKLCRVEISRDSVICGECACELEHL